MKPYGVTTTLSDSGPCPLLLGTEGHVRMTDFTEDGTSVPYDCSWVLRPSAAGQITLLSVDEVTLGPGKPVQSLKTESHRGANFIVAGGI